MHCRLKYIIGIRYGYHYNVLNSIIINSVNITFLTGGYLHPNTLVSVNPNLFHQTLLSLGPALQDRVQHIRSHPLPLLPEGHCGGMEEADLGLVLR